MIKPIIKLSTSYAATQGIQKGVMLLLTPLLTSYILPKEYGNIAIVVMLVSIFKIIFTLSLESTIMRYYLRIKNNEILAKEFLGSIIFFIGIMFLIFLTLLLVFGEIFFKFIFADFAFYPYIMIAALLTMVQQINSIYITMLKAVQNIKDYIIFYNALFVFQTGLILLFVITKLDSSDLNYLYALLIANIIFSFISFYKLKAYISFVLKMKLIKIALGYSLSILPIQLINIVNSSVDRYILFLMLGNSVVGVYYIAYQVSSAASMVMLAINSALIPTFFKIYENNKSKNNFYEINTIMDKIVFISGIIEAILLLGYPLFYYFLNDSYHGASNAISILILSNIMLSIYYLNTNALSISIRLNRKKILGVLLGVLVNVLLSFSLVEMYGMLGVAIGTLMGFMTSTMYFIFLVKKFTTFQFDNFMYIFYYFIIFSISLLFSDFIWAILGEVIVIFLFWKFYFSHKKYNDLKLC